MTSVIVSSLPPVRFAPYLAACGGNSVAAEHLYFWNLDVSSAFAWVLTPFETTVRNAIHDSLGAHFRQEDWWTVARRWLKPGDVKAVDDAVTSVREHVRDRPARPDDVVAKLSLGFWVGLTGTRHNYETRFWRSAVRHAFPHYQGRRSGALNWELNSVRHLRNRISHCEPIHAAPLAHRIEQVYTTIEYINPELGRELRDIARVETVLAQRPCPD